MLSNFLHRFKSLNIKLFQHFISIFYLHRKVCSGPFKGMRYLKQAHMSAYFPKLLGTYELELNDIIEKIISMRPEKIVNIGAAEGYYAVGLARRLPQTEVIAFEEKFDAIQLINRLSCLNGVSSNLKIMGCCSQKDLLATLASQKKTILLIDIEGGEKDLLEQSIMPFLNNVDLLLEVHEVSVPNLSTNLKNLFHVTHNCIEFDARKRELDDLPNKMPKFVQNSIFSRSLLLMMDEQRSDGLKWLYFQSKT
jgi:precorrin-6B methylase 2